MAENDKASKNRHETRKPGLFEPGGGRGQTAGSRATVRQIVRDHCADVGHDGARFATDTATWFARCPDCLEWHLDADSPFTMEAALGQWVGRWAEQSGADQAAVTKALTDYTEALRAEYAIP